MFSKSAPQLLDLLSNYSVIMGRLTAGGAVTDVILHAVSLTLAAAMLRGGASTEACPLSAASPTGNTAGWPTPPRWPLPIHWRGEERRGEERRGDERRCFNYGPRTAQCEALLFLYGLLLPHLEKWFWGAKPTWKLKKLRTHVTGGETFCILMFAKGGVA